MTRAESRPLAQDATPADDREDWSRRQAPAEFRECASPTIATEDVRACPVCGCDQFGTHAVGFDYELRTCANPWRFVQCRGSGCGHVWLTPRPAISTLGVIYPRSYYAYNYASQINPVSVWAKQRLDAMKFASILRALPATPTSYLDIGCGDGRFLKLLERHGVPRDRNYGLELDENVVKPLAQAGYKAYCERVESCDKIPAASIDLATMFHVIEHVDDPGAVVERVASWLSPGGVFAVETPNLDSWDARLFRRTYWGGYHIPRHWNLFTPATLRRLFETHGLEVVATKYQTGHSFWMYSMHHWTRYQGRPWKTLSRWFDPFKGMPLLACFTALDKARGLLGFRTSAMLMLARRRA